MDKPKCPRCGKDIESFVVEDSKKIYANTCDDCYKR